MALFRPQTLNFVLGAITDELNFTTWETNQIITVRVQDILGVEQQPAGVTFPSDSGPVSRLYFSDHSILIRRSRTDVLSDIAALAPVLPLGTVYVQDQKGSGTDGGTATSGSWQTRDLNTIVSDPSSLVVTLTANQLDLLAGTYEVLVMAPGQEVQGFQTRLQNIDLVTTEILGTTCRSEGKHMTTSFIQGVFTIGVTTTLEIQMQVQATLSTTGFGQAKGFTGTSEVYTTARFRRIS